MNRVRILNTYFDGGKPKYLAGQEYGANADTVRMVALGHAVYVVGAEVEFPVAEPVASADPETVEPDRPNDAAQDDPASVAPKRRGRPPKSAQQTPPDSN